MWVALALWWGLGLHGANEPSPSSTVRWTTVPGCPDAGVVRERVTELLATGPPGPAWAAQGTVEVVGEKYVLHLELDIGAVQEFRQLEASDCTLLADAAALVIAVTVDAQATAAALEQESRDAPAAAEVPPKPAVPSPTPIAPELPPASAAPPTPVEVRSAPATRRPLPPSRVPIGVSAGLAGGMSLGVIPGISGGVEGSLGLQLGQAQLVLAGHHWFATTADAEAQPSAGIRAAASGGSIRGCYALSEGRVDIPLCGGIDLAAIHGQGQGTQVNPQSFRDLWIGATASAGVHVRLGRRFALSARADGIAALRRPAAFLSIDGEPQEVFRSAPVGLRLVAGPTFFLR